MLRYSYSSRITKALVFWQWSWVREALSTLFTLHLHTAIHVHPSMPAKIGKLCICLETHLALVRLYWQMDMRVLLKSWGCGKCLSTLVTSVASGSDVVSTNVPLQIWRITEYLKKYSNGTRWVFTNDPLHGRATNDRLKTVNRMTESNCLRWWNRTQVKYVRKQNIYS